jgi:putative membrane protein
MKINFHFNIQHFVKFLVLLSSYNLIHLLIASDQLSLYIHPRFTIFMEIADILLLIMAVTQFVRIFFVTKSLSHCGHTHEHTHFFKSDVILFVATLFFSMIFPNTTLDANLVADRGLNTRLTPNVASEENLPRPLAAKLKAEKIITVTDLNYTEVMSELNQFPDDYIGKEINMTGFVFRSSKEASNQFSLVRYVITCCTADALPYGVLGELKSAQQYPDGTWLEIHGVMDKGKFEDQSVGMIKLTSLKKINEPKKPYVFPYDE